MEAVIQAIETEYQDYKFRSRLEARWAVFMSELGVPYEYEKEGYDLEDYGWYLPDFWLPTMDSWLEIKGAFPSAEEQAKCEKLAIGTRKTVYLSWAAIPSAKEVANNGVEHILAYKPTIFMGKVRGWVDRDIVAWCACPRCGAVGLAHNGDGTELSREGVCDCLFEIGYHVMAYDAPHILDAYRKARSERFDRARADGRG